MSGELEQCHHEEKHGDESILGSFLLTTLAAGIIFRVLAKQFAFLDAVPYTLSVLIFGVVLGAAHSRSHFGGALGYSLTVWTSLSPELLLYMFIPPLLFSSAYVVDWHVFKRLFWQAALMATVGVVLTMFLVALVAKYWMGTYQWTWLECLMFGAMFSATDPVAVVALLADLGAPETIGVLIEGESLMNDGTAFVLFIVLESKVAGFSNLTPGEIVGEVAYSSVVGPMIGAALAFVSLVFMSWIWSDAVLEVVVTMIVAWGSFFFGEMADASGVLSVVTLGLCLAGYSVSYVNADAAIVLKEFWRIIEYVANTVVFCFSGVVVATKLAESNTSVTGKDFGYLILLYVSLNSIRFVVVGVLYWPLSKLGYGMHWKKAALLTWSGLRGAVGLIAALFLLNECHCPEGDLPEDLICLKSSVADEMMFFMSGIVLLTLMINGPTTSWLLDYVQLSKQTPAARLLFERAVTRMQEHTDHAVRSLKRVDYYKGADWALVWSYMPVLSSTSLESATAKRNRNQFVSGDEALRKEILKIEKRRFESSACEVTKALLVCEARHRFLNLVKSNYRRRFKDGAVHSWPSLSTLLEAASRAQDHDDTPIDEWNRSLRNRCYLPEYYKRWLLWWMPRKLQMSLIINHLAVGYDLATSFIIAHKAVELEFLEVTFDVDVAKVVLLESRKMVRDARQFLKDVESSFGEISRAIKTDIAIQRLLRDSLNFSDELLDNAEIDERDHEFFHRGIERSLKRLTRRTHSTVSVQSELDILRGAHFFEGTSDKLFSLIKRKAILRVYRSGQVLMKRGDERASVFVVVRGKVKLMMRRVKVMDTEDVESWGELGSSRTKHQHESHIRKQRQNARKYNHHHVIKHESRRLVPPKRELTPFERHEDSNDDETQDSEASINGSESEDSYLSAPSVLDHDSDDEVRVSSRRGKKKAKDDFSVKEVSQEEAHSFISQMRNVRSFDELKRLSSKDLQTSPPEVEEPLWAANSTTLCLQEDEEESEDAAEASRSASPGVRLDPTSLESWRSAASNVSQSSLRNVRTLGSRVRGLARRVTSGGPAPHVPEDDDALEDVEAPSTKKRVTIQEDPGGRVKTMTHHLTSSHHHHVETVWAVLGRGDTIGEMELIADMPIMATAICDSIVEAYEIDYTFLRELLETRVSDADVSVLYENLIKQAGVLALESHFPRLRSAPYSLTKWLLHHIDVLRPKPDEDVLFEEGKGIILTGSVVGAGDVVLDHPLVPITVFDAPDEALRVSESTTLLFVPYAACLLAEQTVLTTKRLDTRRTRTKSSLSGGGESASETALLYSALFDDVCTDDEEDLEGAQAPLMESPEKIARRARVESMPAAPTQGSRLRATPSRGPSDVGSSLPSMSMLLLPETPALVPEASRRASLRDVLTPPPAPPSSNGE